MEDCAFFVVGENGAMLVRKVASTSRWHIAGFIGQVKDITVYNGSMYTLAENGILHLPLCDGKLKVEPMATAWRNFGGNANDDGYLTLREGDSMKILYVGLAGNEMGCI